MSVRSLALVCMHAVGRLCTHDIGGSFLPGVIYRLHQGNRISRMAFFSITAQYPTVNTSIIKRHLPSASHSRSDNYTDQVS